MRKLEDKAEWEDEKKFNDKMTEFLDSVEKRIREIKSGEVPKDGNEWKTVLKKGRNLGLIMEQGMN